MTMRPDDFMRHLDETAATVETALAAILDPQEPLVAGTPARLLDAMRHGALGGGKRLRPVLLLETARLFGEVDEDAMRVAAALEFVHCYSLVHDDLPAMDDDDMRRGRPTVHKAFDEATAILAGDGLLTLASGLVASAHAVPAEARLELIRCLSMHAGVAGMVGGQALDLAAETTDLSLDEIARMQAMKTGALIAFACEAGAILAQASDADRTRLRDYGEIVGLAFQLADDLLDETGDAATIGKAAGKDAARGKKTIPALKGHDWTRRRLDELVREAEGLLDPYGAKADILKVAARFVAIRTK